MAQSEKFRAIDDIGVGIYAEEVWKTARYGLYADPEIPVRTPRAPDQQGIILNAEGMNGGYKKVEKTVSRAPEKAVEEPTREFGGMTIPTPKGAQVFGTQERIA